MSQGPEAIATQDLTPEQEEALRIQANQEGEKLVNRIKVLGLQVDTMEPADRLKYTGQFDKLGKSLGKLRRILRKKMPDNSWHLTVWLCVTILVLIYG